MENITSLREAFEGFHTHYLCTQQLSKTLTKDIVIKKRPKTWCAMAPSFLIKFEQRKLVVKDTLKVH